MSIRNLDFLFKPRSIALIGASKQPGSIGAVVAHNLFNFGYDGPIMPVNPRHRAIEGVLAYPDAGTLPEVPDLAVIATPPATVPDLITSLGARGTRAAIVISAGFGEGGEAEGKRLMQAMLDAAKPHTLRVVGPNCIGVAVPGIGLNATFADTLPKPGHLAFVAQSGAIVTSVLDWATARGIGFSHVVSLGDLADVDFGDMLDYLANDGHVRAILLYIEAITHARKFMSAARAAARLKPVIVVKAGRTSAGARAAASHTGALAGSDDVYDAAFRRAGMLRVADLGALFGAVETLGLGRMPKGDRLAILSNGGGIGILATDALIEAGGRLTELSGSTMAALAGFLPPTWSRGNPVDIIGDATGSRYAKALSVLLDDETADAILVMKCPTAVASGTDVAKAIVEALGKRRACVLTCWLGEDSARDARTLFAAHGIPTYFTPERAVRAFMDMVNYRRNQDMLMETPPSAPEHFAIDHGATRRIVDGAVGEGREWLSEPDAKALLAVYGIATVATRVVADADAAAAAAADIGKPVALKILSRDITHKSDVGGVALDLRTPAAVREACAKMLDNVRTVRPDARVDGFTVQEMLERPWSPELIIGVNEDAQFGPVILFGYGGTAVEIIADTALALPPLNMHLARDLMSRTKVFELLRGFRGHPAADLDEIALALIKVSQMVIDLAEIVEVDINPLLADEHGVVALDARVRLRRTPPPAQRLAISPYPKDLEETVELPDGRRMLLRPVLPEDEPALREMYAKLPPEDVRMRFFAPTKVLSHAMAARMTQIDYDREMALMLVDPELPGTARIHGGVRIAADPDGERAEFAITVAREMAGQGLGAFLMRRIIDYAQRRGIKEIFGEVLRDNRPMLRLCEILHFTNHVNEDDPSVVEVRLQLS